MNITYSLDQTQKTSDLNADSMMRQYELDKMAKFLELKSKNPRIKQSEIAKLLELSSSTIQRYRKKINMFSPYRILPSSKTNHTRKQKTTNMNHDDVNVTPKNLKMTSNDLKETSNEPVRNKKKKLKGGVSSNVHISGKDSIEQAFSYKWIDEFIEIMRKWC